MNLGRIQPGLCGEADLVVGEAQTTPRIGSGMHERVAVNIARFDERVDREVVPHRLRPA